MDAELTHRGLVRSRTHAARLIAGGAVRLDGRPVTRAAAPVRAGQRLEVDLGDDVASRGAYKLRGALEALEPHGLVVRGRRCLDAGASTGGFTDVLLRRGASSVVAVDVGTGQLDPRVAADDRVEVRDGTNVRHLGPQDVRPAPGLVVADLSFISLRLVLAALAAVAAPGADLLVMVKPQFEVGRERIGADGVVRSAHLRVEAVSGVLDAALELGLDVHGVTESVLPGPSGNHEYFLWLSAPGGSSPARPVLDAAGARARVADVVAGSSASRDARASSGSRREGR